MTEIRHKDGVPTIADFHSTKGPPIVVNTATGAIYTVDANDTVAAQGGGTVADGSITTAKLGGDITTAGKALLDDADAAAQLTTLGAAASGHTHAQLHDAVTVADSTTVDLTLTGQQVAAAAITQMSITSDASGLKLSGDATTPGNSKLYGTNGSGTKGWYAQPAGGEAFPIGAVFIAVVNTDPGTLLGYGTWSAFGAGKVLVGRDSGDTDFDTAEETGGAKTVASAGSNAAESTHTHSVTSNVTVADHGSHTHTYTDVPNHVHVQNALPTATGAVIGNTRDTTMSGAAAATGVSTANPTGGVATGTTAGPNATLTHTPTNNAVTSGAGASHNHAFTGSATSVVQPYIVVYMWKRTA
jgi:hypothetical protein